MSEQICFEVKLKDGYAQAVEKVTAALKEEGFGVLTQIDVRATLKEKLGAEFRPYTILGACNPPLAHQALQAEPQVGLMMPCNVTVEEGEEVCTVRLLDPNAMFSMPIFQENAAVCTVAEQARARLKRVAEALGG